MHTANQNTTSQNLKRTLTIIALALGIATIRADDITTLGGKKYIGVTISRATPDGLVVTTDSGIETIPFSDLSPEIRAKYGYDPKKAAEYNAAMQAAAVQRAAEARASASAAQANVQFEKPPKGGTGKPGVHILRVAGKVLQVLPDGILLASDWLNQTLEPYTDDNGTLHEGATIMDEPLFVLGAPSNLVDGDHFSGVVYPAGIYIYAAVTGARKTIRCYATTPKVAAQRQMTK